MNEKQCDYSEGCLRIWVLMSQYSFDTERDLTSAYPGIYKMYDVVKEMPLASHALYNLKLARIKKADQGLLFLFMP